MCDERRADSLVLKAKIHEAPIGKCRNSEPRDGYERPFVIQACREQRTCLRKECRPLLGCFSLGASRLGANELFPLFFGAPALGDIVSCEDHVIRTQYRFGPCDQSSCTVFGSPVVFSVRQVCPGTNRYEERGEGPALYFVLRITKNAFKGAAGADDFLLRVENHDDAVCRIENGRDEISFRLQCDVELPNLVIASRQFRDHLLKQAGLAFYLFRFFVKFDESRNL